MRSLPVIGSSAGVRLCSLHTQPYLHSCNLQQASLGSHLPHGGQAMQLQPVSNHMSGQSARQGTGYRGGEAHGSVRRTLVEPHIGSQLASAGDSECFMGCAMVRDTLDGAWVVVENGRPHKCAAGLGLHGQVQVCSTHKASLQSSTSLLPTLQLRLADHTDLAFTE